MEAYYCGSLMPKVNHYYLICACTDQVTCEYEQVCTFCRNKQSMYTETAGGMVSYYYQWGYKVTCLARLMD